MRNTKLSLCVLLSTTFASAQVAPSAQLVGGQVTALGGTAAPLLSGTNVWPGLSRVAGGGLNSASMALANALDPTAIEFQWQVASQALTSGNSLSRGEVRYELVSPVRQAGDLIIEWLPATTGTGQVTLAIDVYDDGFIDAATSTTIPVVFGMVQYPLAIRVIAEANSQAGTMQGPWGSSWSWSGTSSGQLRIRFVPTHAAATTAAAQICSPAPALTSHPNLNNGVDLEGLCAPTDHFALFALGFQATDLPLPLSTNCRLLLTPIVTLLHPLQPSTAVRQPVTVPAPVRPVHFLAQLITLNATTMTLTASNLIQTNIQ
ncbi:MAG: hypothetical protein ACI85K_002472 [Hyphomicrobiaceae bacterium]|jgi:hypothetical protein